MDIIDKAIADIEELKAFIANYKNILKQRGLNVPPLLTQGLRQQEKNLKSLKKNVDNQEKQLARQQRLIEFITLTEIPQDKYDAMRHFLDMFAELADTTRGAIIANNPGFELSANIYVQTPFSINKKGNYDEHIVKRVLQRTCRIRRPYLTAKVVHDDRFSSGQGIVNFSLHSILVLPLIHDDEIRALVYLDKRMTNGFFTQQDRDVCAHLAQYMGRQLQF